MKIVQFYIIKGIKKLYILSLLISLIIFGSCSQIELEQVNKIEEGEVLEIKDQELSFSIFQIVSIDLGETTFSDGQMVGTTLEGEKIDLFMKDNILSFIVPKLNQGSYKLVFSENNKPFNISFEVEPHELKETPAAYLDKFKTLSLEQIQALEKGMGPIPEEKGEELKKDIELLKQQTEEQFANAALLNESELIDMAYFFEANNQWFTEILNTAIDLEADFPDARLLQAEVTNVEQQTTLFSKRLITSVIEVAAKIGFVTLMGVLGGLLGVEGGTPGIVIGASIGIISGYLILKRITGRADKLFSLIQVPNDSQVNVNVRASYVFENDAPTELLVYRNYRNLYSKDKESTIPYIKNYVLASQTLSEAWEDLIRNIKLFNDKLDLSYKPINPASLEDFENTLFRVHSDHLNFSGITNPKVTGSAKKEDGKLFLTFNTAETDAQEFNFNLTYENHDFGKLEKTLDAAVINSGCSVKLELTEKNVLTATATGYGPFKFAWSTGQNIEAAKTNSINASKSGDISVTVTDQEGCESHASVNVPCSLKIDVLNDGNTYTIEVLDGLPPFSYQWSTNSDSKTQTLPPGTHTVKVRDALNCEISESITINDDGSDDEDEGDYYVRATINNIPYEFNKFAENHRHANPGPTYSQDIRGWTDMELKPGVNGIMLRFFDSKERYELKIGTYKLSNYDFSTDLHPPKSDLLFTHFEFAIVYIHDGSPDWELEFGYFKHSEGNIQITFVNDKYIEGNFSVKIKDFYDKNLYTIENGTFRVKVYTGSSWFED